MTTDLLHISSTDHVSHARRGGDYTFLGWGTFQADQEVHRDHDSMSVYLSDHGLLCIRPRDEFLDGRFSPIDGAPSPWIEVMEELDRLPLTPQLEAILARVRDLAARSIVLGPNAMLSGVGAFDQAARTDGSGRT